MRQARQISSMLTGSHKTGQGRRKGGTKASYDSLSGHVLFPKATKRIEWKCQKFRQLTGVASQGSKAERNKLLNNIS